MDDRQKYKDLISNFKSIQKELKDLKEKIKKESIVQDDELVDDVEAFREAFEAGNVTLALELAKRITKGLELDAIGIEIDDPYDVLKEEAKITDLYSFPREFKLANIGVRPSITIVVGAPPKVGKTSFGCNIAYDNCLYDRPTLFFSCEMTSGQIWTKILQIHFRKYLKATYTQPNLLYGINNNGSVEKEAFDFVNKKKGILKVIDSSSLSADKIINVYFAEKKKYDIDPIAIIDYAQIVKPPSTGKGKTKREEMISISNTFRDACKETKSNFILLSQLNKEGEYKESGAFGEDAGMLMKLNRDFYEDTCEFSDNIDLIIERSRFTQTTKSTVQFCPVTGAIGV